VEIETGLGYFRVDKIKKARTLGCSAGERTSQPWNKIGHNRAKLVVWHGTCEWKNAKKGNGNPFVGLAGWLWGDM